MLTTGLTIAAIAATTVSAAPATKHMPKYVDWSTFNATGVNLGGWMVQELTIDTGFWADFAGNQTDEWTVCAANKTTCGKALERRYATWITTCDIDRLAAAGITLLRIPTNYATWIEVPGSQLYHGNQLEYLKKITAHAVEKHGMHVVLDLHSLPGGLNGLDIGERVGARQWFHNTTALDYSLAAVDRVLDFIAHSGHPQHFTLEPANEPSDNTDFSTFGTPATLSANGSEWVLKYYKAVLDRVRKSQTPRSVRHAARRFPRPRLLVPPFPARARQDRLRPAQVLLRPTLRAGQRHEHHDRGRPSGGERWGIPDIRRRVGGADCGGEFLCGSEGDFQTWD
jgi:hypothetical protein